MRLTLTYRGRLRSRQRGIGPEKAALRRAFHPQIRSQLATRLDQPSSELRDGLTTTVDGVAFLAPVSMKYGTAADLHVLLLTPATAASRADLDNRTKAIIDGLTRPQNRQQMQDYEQPESDEPICVLLEDDSLVESLTVDQRFWHEPDLDAADVLVVVTAHLTHSTRPGRQPTYGGVTLVS